MTYKEIVERIVEQVDAGFQITGGNEIIVYAKKILAKDVITEIKSCKTCNDDDTPIDIKPCRNCEEFSKWTPKKVHSHDCAKAINGRHDCSCETDLKQKLSEYKTNGLSTYDMFKAIIKEIQK